MLPTEGVAILVGLLLFFSLFRLYFFSFLLEPRQRGALLEIALITLLFWVRSVEFVSSQSNK